MTMAAIAVSHLLPWRQYDIINIFKDNGCDDAMVL
jgi:hypothetical protein